MIKANQPLFAGLVLLLASALSGLVFVACKKANSGEHDALASQREVTFNKKIAPILFQKCAPCHRPGQSAPFSLLSYAEVRKKDKLIGEVTERRSMPPWLPEHGYGQFAGERWLSVDEIGLIKQWLAEGAGEGKL